MDALAHECMFKAPVVKETIEERVPTASVEPIKTKDGVTKAEDTSKNVQFSIHITLYIVS